MSVQLCQVCSLAVISSGILSENKMKKEMILGQEEIPSCIQIPGWPHWLSWTRSWFTMWWSTPGSERCEKQLLWDVLPVLLGRQQDNSLHKICCVLVLDQLAERSGVFWTKHAKISKDLEIHCVWSSVGGLWRGQTEAQPLLDNCVIQQNFGCNWATEHHQSSAFVTPFPKCLPHAPLYHSPLHCPEKKMSAYKRKT